MCWTTCFRILQCSQHKLLESQLSAAGVTTRSYRHLTFEELLIGIQGSPTFSAHFGPTAGRNGSWGEPPPGQPDLLAANQPCWPFRRCLMKRSFYVTTQVP